MTTHSSTVAFDAYNAFYAIVNTQLSAIKDPQWAVFDGDPRQGEYNNIAAVLGINAWNQQPAGIGAGVPSFPLDESFEINARLACWDQTITQSATRGSIATAFKAIETGVRNDPTLGGLVLWSYLGATIYEQGATDASGSSAQIDIYLACKARII